MISKLHLSRTTLALILLGSWLHSANAAEPAPPTSPKVSFPDKKLEAAVRKSVFEKRDNDQPLTEADLAHLSVIQAQNAGNTNLTGLEKCVNLATLDLAKNQVTDLAPLSGMNKLQFLDLSNNRVERVSTLSTNHALQYLELSGNRVKDIKALALLTNMASLYLSGNRIEDASAVMKLPRIASLYLDRNQIKSIQGVNQLQTLSSFSAAGNRISELSPLNGLTRLSFLMLENNKIKDLGTLVEMGRKDKEQRFAPFLQLYLKGNPLSNKAKKTELPELEKIGMRIKS